MSKKVLSLCDYSANMVRPWAGAGYECIVVDRKHNDVQEEYVGDGLIRFVEADVDTYNPPSGEYRIGFAFPPCTDLAVSGAAWFKQKGLRSLADAIDTVGACKETLGGLDCQWMLENPVSTLSTYWRDPDYKFDPYQYQGYTDRDEAYTKETWLWTGGGFKMPKPDTDVSEEDADNRIHMMGPSEDRAEKRSETPMGFARAVYLAHEEDGYARADSGFEQTTVPEAAD